ncbi:MAG: glycosyl hydrolase [Flavobacteriales bacterium]|nr:glycosyl hydrolase [Flavobacteriales bacterium]
MKKILLLLLLSTISLAQNANRKYISHEFNDGHLKIVVSDGEYQIKLKNDKIAETTFIPKGETYNPTSHAVVLLENNYLESNTKQDNNGLQLSSKGITIDVVISPFQIKYSYKNKPILSEKNGYFKKDSTDVIDFSISSDEFLYGGGARALGMNRRGNRLQLYNRAHYGYETKAELMNFCIPLVLSSNLYAVHFDNAAIGYLDLDSKKDNSLSYETISGRKTYQVIAGDSWDELIKNYTNLTGKQPLPPRWVFGNLSSRFGYRSQEQVEKTIKRFEDDKIPVDGIILDLYWFGKTVQGTMGNLDWDKDNFPNPEKMIADLNAKGFKTILITEPFVLTTSSKWQEAVDKKILATDTNGNPFKYDFYFGNTGIIDIFNPNGKEWFWNVYKRLINQGVGGLWGDLGEPEVFPSAAITAGGKADEVHNVYGHNWAKLIADGYKKDFPNQRPFILMRSGYSGSQRFGMIPWSGDVSRSWGGLQSQTEIALQMGMQGMAYMHSDLGGFAGDYFDNELYLRWLQFGVFSPIFRPHAQEDVASEVAYKDVDTKAKAKKAVELRYQLLPYNYNLAYENTQFGTPLMRPIFFEEPTNTNALNSASGYFWGKSFLVYPITEKGQKEKEVYFPKSSNWFDFYTGKKYVAGTTVKVKTEELYIPTFVRGGSFIPMYKVAQNTSKINTEELDVHYFHEIGISTETTMYSDDGATPFANNKDLFETVNFKSGSTQNQLVLSMYVTTASKYRLSQKKINYIVHNINKKPKSILVNSKQIPFEYDNKTKTVVFSGVQEGNYLASIIQF